MPSITRLAQNIAAKIWPVVTARSRQGRQWAAVQFGSAQQWPSARKQAAFIATGVVAVVLLLIFSGVTAAVAAVAAWVALLRHFAQTDADRQRRITESFSKAIEQLGSDKLEVRLGGIYGLERISQESPHDHWTVMENLTAFVRERTQRTEAYSGGQRDQRIARRAYGLWENAGRPEGRSGEFWREAVKQEPPEADIAAVLAVIMRRSAHYRANEYHRITHKNWNLLKPEGKWRLLDFERAVLCRASLVGAPLELVDFREAHLEGADLRESDLKMAWFDGTHLEGADLSGADLAGAWLDGAHLEGANLRGADLTAVRLDGAFGDAATQLPEKLTPPAHWNDPTAPPPRPIYPRS